MQISIQEVNATIGSVNYAYNGIILKGFYLPKRTSSLLTTDYLFKVMTNRVFRIKLQDVQIGQLIQKTSSQTLKESLLEVDVDKSWGFDQDHFPNEIWMTNVLYTLKPNHGLFGYSLNQCLSILTAEDLKQFVSQIFQELFQLSKLLTIEIISHFFKQQNELRKVANKKQKLKQKKLQIKILNKQIQELEAVAIQGELEN